MSATVTSTALIVATYLLGSVSGAVLVSRWFALPDPRQSGSGNPGATNVLRSGHRLAAALTLIIDLLKGVLPVLLARHLELSILTVSLVAVAAVSGHLWPLFFHFRGGKGVATILGTSLGFAPLLGLAQVAAWLLLAYAFKMSSLSALIMALLTPLLCLWLAPDYLIVACFLCALLVLRHRDNIHNLRHGSEPRL